MWSKLFSWSSQKKNEPQPQQPALSPAEMVRLALEEIDKNITQNHQSLRETQNTQAQIQGKLRTQIAELNNLSTQAENALRKNDQTTTKNLLEKKVWIQEQAQQYQYLLEQLAQTIQQLEKQIAGLEMRKIEINAKETLLTAQLQKANSQKEMQTYLYELDKTLGFDSFERQIEAINIENQLANDILAFDDALKNSLPTQTIESMQQQAIQAQEDAQNQKMNTLFGRYFEAKKDQLSKQEKTPNPDQKEILQSFFDQKPPEKTSLTADEQKQKQINDFFGK